MAASGVISIAGTIAGEPTGSKSLSGSINLANAVGTTVDLVPASGDNTVAVPSGATAVLIQPPSGNVIAIKLKGAAGDSGVRLHNTNPTLISLDSSQATIIINAASLFANVVELNFV